MRVAAATSNLYGKFHQGLPIGAVTALRALLLRLANVTVEGGASAASAEKWWSTDRHARRAAHDTCYRLFLPFCAAACEPELPQPERGGGGGAAHRPLAPRRPASSASRTQQKSARKETQSPQDAYTTGSPRTPWFERTLGVSGRTQPEWRPDVEEWRNCLCLE